MIQDDAQKSDAETAQDNSIPPTEDLPFPAVQPTEVHVAGEWKYSAPFVSGRFHPGGKHAFAGAQDNTVQRVDLESGTFTSFASHDSWVRAIEFTQDGEKVVTGGYDGRLIWWSALAAEPQPERRIDAHTGWIRYVSRSPDGTRLATSGDDRLVKLWDISTGELLASLSGHEKNAYSVAWHPNGQELFSADLAGKIKRWELSSAKVVHEYDGAALHTYNAGQRVDFGGVRSLALNHDGTLIACSGLHNASNPLGSVHEPLVLLFDVESGELKRSYVADGLKGGVWRVVYHPNGYWIGATSGTSGGFLLFWNATDDKDFHRLKLPQVARDLDLHPDRLQLLTPHFDNQVRVSRMEKKPA